eukprot:750880-Prymnesium_polylepis.1
MDEARRNAFYRPYMLVDHVDSSSYLVLEAPQGARSRPTPPRILPPRHLSIHTSATSIFRGRVR